MNKFICFITGPCAAGKSTVGKMLAEHNSFKKATFIQVDEIRRTVWQGYAPPFPETPASREQLKLAAKATAAVAKLYYEAGFCVFIEEVLEPWLLSIYTKELDGCNVNTVCLLPSDSELMKRDKSRSESEQMGNRCLELWNSFKEWSQSEKWDVLDSSNQSVEETVEKALVCLKARSSSNT